MTPTLNILIIGCDPPIHFDLLLQTASELDGLRIAGLALSHESEPEEITLKAAAQEHGVRFAAHWREVVGQADAVIHLGPYGLRAATILELLRERDLKVLILDKPIACSAEELDQLEVAIESRPGLVVLPLLTLRLDPRYDLMRSICRSGLLGQVTLVQAHRPHKLGRRPEWFFDPTMYPGIIADLCVHDVDALTWSTGEKTTEIASAHEVRMNLGGRTIPAFGGFAATLSNGGAAALSADWLTPAEAPYHGDCRLEIVAEKGKAVLVTDGPRAGICLESADRNPERTLEGIWREFLGAFSPPSAQPAGWDMSRAAGPQPSWTITCPQTDYAADFRRALSSLLRHISAPEEALPATFSDLATATRTVLKASQMAQT